MSLPWPSSSGNREVKMPGGRIDRDDRSPRPCSRRLATDSTTITSATRADTSVPRRAMGSHPISARAIRRPRSRMTSQTSRYPGLASRGSACGLRPTATATGRRPVLEIRPPMTQSGLPPGQPLHRYVPGQPNRPGDKTRRRSSRWSA